VVLAKFCCADVHLAAEPTWDELEALWEACNSLRADAVSIAFVEQLAWKNRAWQPRLRVLHAMRHFCMKGGWGQDVAKEAFEHVDGLFPQFAAEVPEYHRQITKVWDDLRCACGDDSDLDSEMSDTSLNEFLESNFKASRIVSPAHDNSWVPVGHRAHRQTPLADRPLAPL